jgi:hypothetical protein
MTGNRSHTETRRRGESEIVNCAMVLQPRPNILVFSY